MFSLLPAVNISKKSSQDNWRDLIFEADKLYNEHSYKKLRDLLLQYKVKKHFFY